MNMKDMKVSELCELTASNAPAPGGGSISAMAGAFGTALASMVANLTLNKESYASVQEEMNEIVVQTAVLRARLLESIQRDTESFDAVMVAMAMPRTTDEEKLLRREAIQVAYKGAVTVPMSVAELCVGLLSTVETVLRKGNKNAVTDGLCAALQLRAGAIGAIFNVRVNLSAIKDEDFVRTTAEKCDVLWHQVNTLEKAIFALAPELC